MTKIPARPQPGAAHAQRPPRQSGRQAPQTSRPPRESNNAARRRAEQASRARKRKIWMATALAVALAVAGLYIASSGGAKKGAGAYPYQVGHPRPGATVPGFSLASTTGGTWSLGAQKGKTVMLFFQEGINCEPCWTQIKDIQADWPRFRALGIDEVVSVTTDPLSALRQKVADEGITIPLLADPNVSVSGEYGATAHAMAGMANADGHSFVVVGPNGAIKWRADYGGAPNYTMYVPDSSLLTQMKAGGAGGQAL